MSFESQEHNVESTQKRRRLGSKNSKVDLNGGEVQRLRVEKGLSQEELAAACGYSKGYMSQIETGKCSSVSKQCADVLAKVLEADLVLLTSDFRIAQKTSTLTGSVSSDISAGKTGYQRGVTVNDILIAVRRVDAAVTGVEEALSRLERRLRVDS